MLTEKNTETLDMQFNKSHYLVR